MSPVTDHILVADVGLDSRSAGSEAVYTYRARSGTRVGEACFVPLGPRRAIGFVLAVREVSPDDLGFAVTSLRDLGETIHGLDLPATTVALVEEVSRQTLTTISTCLGLAVPPGIRDRLITEWVRTAAEATGSLTPSETETLTVLAAEPVVDTKTKRLPDGAKRNLRKLEKKGLAMSRVSLAPAPQGRRLVGQLRIIADEDRINAFLTGPGRKRPAQALTLMRLQGSEVASFSVQEIKSLGGVTDQTIRALIDAGLLESATDEVAPAPVPTLNPYQSAAVGAIVQSIRESAATGFLLYGVTGSGKTEVYLRAAQEALQSGRQVMYLVPEIALTAQVIAQLRARFGHRVAVLHSNMSPAERLESWIRVRTGAASVVLGARSALFAPVSNLGLIILDEEHEQSYKQDSAPRYHSKSLASWLASVHHCPYILGSATPSIESFHESIQGDLTRLDLPIRAADAQLPTVFVEDLGEGYRSHRPALFTPQLDRLFRETIARDEQVILFLNRRAYAPFVVCRDCQHMFMCPKCAVSLSLHRRDQRLRCHHCGHHERVPETCPNCQSDRVGAFGVGVEKVEEFVAETYPEARVARLDRDVARRKGGLEETLARFRSGETNVLVGTQLVAKGLDFPRVTLVGVIAADLSLNFPDFRASERTFQLLSQVAGRAGRGDRPGSVVIQTLVPEHPAVVCAQTHDYAALFSRLITERGLAHYPPFCRLVNIVFTGDSQPKVLAISTEAGIRLSQALPEDEILGPVDCPIERLNGMWRRHIIVKLRLGASPAPIAAAVAGLANASVRIIVDVDAYNLI